MLKILGFVYSGAIIVKVLHIRICFNNIVYFVEKDILYHLSGATLDESLKLGKIKDSYGYKLPITSVNSRAIHASCTHAITFSTPCGP